MGGGGGWGYSSARRGDGYSARVEAGGGRGLAVRPDAVEADLAELDEHEVEDDHQREDGEETGGERDEPEHVSEW